MRLRPLALDRQASFGITSSVDDAKPGANTLKSCSYALNVDQVGTHKLKPHDGITSRRAMRDAIPPPVCPRTHSTALRLYPRSTA